MIALRRGRSFAISPPVARTAILSLGITALVVMAGVVISRHVAPEVLLALAVVAGLPHGAGDLGAGRALFRDFRTAWWLPFLLGYVGLVGVTLGAWTVTPTLALAVFLLLSIAHFGMQDAATSSATSILAHGGAPIIVTALFHPQEVERLFAFLIGSQSAPVAAVIRGPIAWIWLAASAMLIWRTARDARLRHEEHAWPAIADLLLVGVLFAAAPPLVAFSVYFALIHTPRALRERRREAGMRSSARQTAGLTALACLLGVSLFWFGHGLTPEANVVRTSFLLLSALTVPHMALEYLKSRQAPLRRPSSPVGRVHGRVLTAAVVIAPAGR